MKKEKKIKGISLQKNGYYRVKIIRDGKIKSTNCKDLETAKQKLKEFKKEFKIEKKTDLKRTITVSEAFDLLLEYKSTDDAVKIRERSIERLKQTIDLRIIPYQSQKNKKIGDKKLIDVTSKEIQRNIQSLNEGEKKYSYSEIKKVYDAWKMLFKHMVEIGLIEDKENPMINVKMLKKQNTENVRAADVKVYTDDEIKKLKEELEKNNYRYGRLIELCLSTGLREAELAGLKKSDFDLKNKILSVHSQVYNKEIVEYLKTSTSKRQIPLTDNAISLYKKLLEEFPEGELLVYTEDFKPVLPGYLNKSLTAALRRAGLPKYGGMHVLRDTFASIAFDSGIDLVVVSRWLGHTDIRVTQKHYLSILQNKHKSEIEKLNNRL